MELLKVAIYGLCFLTSAACAYLLLRGFWRTGTRLLFWSGLCFAFLAANNFAVILDFVVFPDISFGALRQATSLIAVGTLLVGLVWESE